MRGGPWQGGRQAALWQVGKYKPAIEARVGQQECSVRVPTVGSFRGEGAVGQWLLSSGGQGTQRGQSTRPPGLQGLRGMGSVRHCLSVTVTLIPFQFFAFITTLLYILHAFSIYYH